MPSRTLSLPFAAREITGRRRRGLAPLLAGLIATLTALFLVAPAGPAAAAPSDPVGWNWTLRKSLNDNGWRSVTFGNGLFVAVAQSGATNRVMTSPDGITWTGRAAAAANSWVAVTYGNGLFVAVAQSGTGNRVMTSPDGITWTARTSAADAQWTDIVYGNGLFVAVGQGVPVTPATSPATYTTGNRVMTSTDGVTWSLSTSTPIAIPDNEWLGVGYGNGLFVATAITGTGNRLMTSPDGVNWTTRSVENKAWYDVTYGNGTYVAIGGPGNAMSSTDGITWTPRTAANGNGWRRVIYANNMFVATAVANDGVGGQSGKRVMTSPDGVTWTARSTNDNSWWGIAYGKGVFVSVASAGAGSGDRVMTSNPLMLTQNGDILNVVPASSTTPDVYRIQYNTPARISAGQSWGWWAYNWAGMPTAAALTQSTNNVLTISLANYQNAGSCVTVATQTGTMPAADCPRPPAIGVLTTGQSRVFRVQTRDSTTGTNIWQTSDPVTVTR